MMRRDKHAARELRFPCGELVLTLGTKERTLQAVLDSSVDGAAVADMVGSRGVLKPRVDELRDDVALLKRPLLSAQPTACRWLTRRHV